MVGAAVALLVAFFVGGAVVRLGPRIGFVDVPDGYLKPHSGAPVPLGGIALFAAVHAGLVTAGRFDWGLLAASALMLALGLVDDRRGLSPEARLVVTALAGVVLARTAELSGTADGVAPLLVTVAIVVVTVNAVNLLDGLDGLVGSVAVITAVGIAVLAADRGLESTYGLVLGAAVAGFLIWNWPPARLFLGDNGAYALALFLVYGFFQATPPAGEIPLLVACGLLGVFAIDLVVTLLRRAVAGRPLFIGDRSHVYDQLCDRGWSVPAVAALMAAAQTVMVGVVVVADRMLSPTPTVIVLVGAALGAVFALGAGGFLRTDGDRSAGE